MLVVIAGDMPDLAGHLCPVPIGFSAHYLNCMTEPYRVECRSVSFKILVQCSIVCIYGTLPVVMLAGD